ncbi:unnamed protein product [Closterium sp. NIES-65]|nr:unnamed protein product [Closterium sp. NIES-65]
MAPPPLIHASCWTPAKFLPCLPLRIPAASPRGRRITTAGGSLRLPVAAAAVTAHRRCNAFPSPTAVALSAARPLASPATPRAVRVRAASARLSSPFTRAPSSLRFTKRACQQLSNPHLFPVPSPSLLNSSRRTSRVSRSGRVLRPGRARALLAPLLAAIGVSFAAVLAALPAALTAVFAALPAALTAVSAATTAIASNATVSSVALPLLQLLAGVGGAVGVVTLGLIWTVLDRLFCLILLLNFAAGLLSIARDSYRLSHARRRSLQDPTLVTIWAAERDERDADDGISEGMAASARKIFLDTGDPRFDWFVPGVVSLIPGVNGAAWVLASWHSSPFLSRGLKRHLALNAAVYGLPGLASLLIFALGVPSPTSLLLSPFSSLASAILSPFSQSAAATAAGSAAAAAAGGVTVVGYGSSSAWWVSVVLGAVQLQLERVRAVSMQESRQVLRAFGRGLKRTRERRLGQRKWMDWGVEEEEETEEEEEGVDREREGRYGENGRLEGVSAAMGGASGGGRAGGAGKDGNAPRGSSGNIIISSSSSSSRGGGDMWMEAEERRRLQEFDAKLMGRPLQQMGPPAAWTTDDVATWLTAEGFACYAQAFLRHAVCGQVLFELTAEDLRDDLGVRTLGDRKRLLAAIAQLRLCPPAYPCPSLPRLLSLLPTLVVLLLALSLPAARGEISDALLEADKRAIVLFDTFGFESNGHVDMNVSSVEVLVPENAAAADKTLMGFFLTTAEDELELQNDFQAGHCVLANAHVHRLFTLQDVVSQQQGPDKPFTLRYTVPDAKEYSLFFANCQPHARVSLNCSFALYNVAPSGRIDYLPGGKTQLPMLYSAFYLAYMVAGIVWIYLCHKHWARTHRIHILMGVLVLLKAFTVLSQAGEYAYIRATGDPQGWNIAFYVFSFFRGIMLFTVIVLIGTGWSVVKPYLQDKEKKVILIVIPLQVFANIATIILDESGPSSQSWFTWRDIFHLLDILCCCAVFFPIIWSIKHLREVAHSDGKAARIVAKLQLFRHFYVLVVCYIYFTRIVVYVLRSTMPYQNAWTADLAGELVTLVFYCVTGYQFRPMEENPFLAVHDDDTGGSDGIEMDKGASKPLKAGDDEDDEFDL